MHISPTTSPAVHAHRHADGTNHPHPTQGDRHGAGESTSAKVESSNAESLGRSVDVRV